MSRTPITAKELKSGGTGGRRASSGRAQGARSNTGTRDQLGSQHIGADDIAVVAMAGRFPGANSVDALWQNLVDGADSVTEMPSDRWDVSALYAPEPVRDKATVNGAGSLATSRTSTSCLWPFRQRSPAHGPTAAPVPDGSHARA
ncbi:beta-ketoacyl synthase N-terminal-like domain-containing protein [Kordiimonas gwangyangensis]|uniref:beta-ketoacyl synthase N-terminal-like domain-containing protein n=1 Tax=Kordiimonas gwangyangensis TaxID=288022 RepID=UPI000471BB88|nr:beta-ketoacyl synthase N-terminal-like domain-containing protein [Kordiimonas gwangyangensis]